jgi:small subunit ribosomal protein S16
LVKLRLRRAGKKKQPIYKIVAADSRTSRSGKFIESIGHYNPLVNPMVVTVKEDRLYTWLKRGAEPTDTVRSLLQRKGYWLKWNLMKRGATEVTIATEMEKWQGLQEEKMRRDDERKARRKAAHRKKAAEAAPAAPATPEAAPVEPAAAPTV